MLLNVVTLNKSIYMGMVARLNPFPQTKAVESLSKRCTPWGGANTNLHPQVKVAKPSANRVRGGTHEASEVNSFLQLFNRETIPANIPPRNSTIASTIIPH